jgi:hypothetical protein
MTPHKYRGAKLFEALCFQRFEHARVCVHLLSRLQNSEPRTLARTA